MWCNNSTWMLYGLLFSCVVVGEKVDDPVCNSKMGKKSKKSNKNVKEQHIIVEMHNVAEFLSEVNNILGKEGTKDLQGLRFEEDVISSKSGYIDNTLKTSNINHVLSAKIGEDGVPITIDNVIECFNVSYQMYRKERTSITPTLSIYSKLLKVLSGRMALALKSPVLMMMRNLMHSAKLGGLCFLLNQVSLDLEWTILAVKCLSFPLVNKGGKYYWMISLIPFVMYLHMRGLRSFATLAGKSEFVLFRCLLWRVQYENSAIRILI